MKWRWLFSGLLATMCAAPADTTAQAQPAQKVSVVSVTGCLKQGPGDTWLLTNATEPIAASRAPAAPSATAPESSRKAAPVTLGKNQFKLIGLLEMNVPAHKGHTVTVRGLLIPAANERRINLTSLQMVSETCSPSTSGSATKRP
jgi:hypothetical protein